MNTTTTNATVTLAARRNSLRHSAEVIAAHRDGLEALYGKNHELLEALREAETELRVSADTLTATLAANVAVNHGTGFDTDEWAALTR